MIFGMGRELSALAVEPRLGLVRKPKQGYRYIRTRFARHVLQVFVADPNKPLALLVLGKRGRKILSISPASNRVFKAELEDLLDEPDEVKKLDSNHLEPSIQIWLGYSHSEPDIIPLLTQNPGRN